MIALQIALGYILGRFTFEWLQTKPWTWIRFYWRYKHIQGVYNNPNDFNEYDYYNLRFFYFVIEWEPQSGDKKGCIMRKALFKGKQIKTLVYGEY